MFILCELRVTQLQPEKQVLTSGLRLQEKV